MKPAVPHSLSLAVACGAALMSSAPARADTASEIRALKKRLGQLEAMVARQHKEERDAKSVAARGNVANAAHVKGDIKGPPQPQPVFVSFRNGLFVETEDKAWNFKVGGRMQFDGGFSSQPLNGWGSQAGVRQVRLEVEGTAAKYFFYKLQYDFAGAQYGGPTNAPVQGGIRDFYLGIQHPLLTLPFAKDPAIIHVGSYFEPFSLEFTASSRFRDFIERAMPVDAIAPNRHLGAAIGAYGADWSAKGGIFTTSFEDLSTNPGVHTPAPLWVPAAANWATTGGSQYFDLTGRVTYAPIKTEHDLLHVGVSGRYHRPNDATGASDDRVLRLGNRVRSEEYILNQGLLGTPDMSCGTVTFANKSAVAGHCVSDVESFGVELSAAHGPFSLQAEYLGTQYNRNMGNVLQARAAGNFAPGGSSHYFSGFYVYGQWYVTGEERAAAYNVSDRLGANFTQIKIKNPVSAGGFGALGLAARYSEVNFNSGPYSGSGLFNMLAASPNAATTAAIVNSGVYGGRQENVTAGLNWYPENGFHIQANWTRAMHVSAPLNDYNIVATGVPVRQGAYMNGAHPNLFEVRAQVYW